MLLIAAIFHPEIWKYIQIMSTLLKMFGDTCDDMSLSMAMIKVLKKDGKDHHQPFIQVLERTYFTKWLSDNHK